MRTSEWRALIAITTCNRLPYLRRYLPHFAAYAARDPRFSLVMAVDGPDMESINFCTEWQVPALFSEQREGVGLSKNRVLERYPDLDYYFFLDDDVELVHGAVFPEHVSLSLAT